MRDIELVQYSKAQMLNQIIDSFRPVIKPGTGGQDSGAGVRELEHILEVNGVVRCFAGDKDKLAALLKANIGGPVN